MVCLGVYEILPNIYPNTIRKLSFKNSTITFFENLELFYENVEVLDLSNMQLVAAPLEVLYLKSLIQLDLSDNFLQEMKIM